MMTRVVLYFIMSKWVKQLAARRERKKKKKGERRKNKIRSDEFIIYAE